MEYFAIRIRVSMCYAFCLMVIIIYLFFEQVKTTHNIACFLISKLNTNNSIRWPTGAGKLKHSSNLILNMPFTAPNACSLLSTILVNFKSSKLFEPYLMNPLCNLSVHYPSPVLLGLPYWEEKSEEGWGPLFKLIKLCAATFWNQIQSRLSILWLINKKGL